LRKLKISKTIECAVKDSAGSVTAAAFDYSGTYLAYTSAGSASLSVDLHICVVKEYTNLLQVSHAI
jgi:hypothetical protein